MTEVYLAGIIQQAAGSGEAGREVISRMSMCLAEVGWRHEIIETPTSLRLEFEWAMPPASVVARAERIAREGRTDHDNTRGDTQ